MVCRGEEGEAVLGEVGGWSLRWSPLCDCSAAFRDTSRSLIEKISLIVSHCLTFVLAMAPAKAVATVSGI